MNTENKLARKKALIERLLVKAAESGNPVEAEIAMTRAEKMMVQYGFDKAEFEKAENKPTEMIVLDVRIRGVYAKVKRMMLGEIIKSYRLVSVFDRTIGDRIWITLVGEKDDVYRMQKVAYSMLAQSDVAMKSWWKNFTHRSWMTKSEGFNTRRTFFIGFGLGAGERVRAILAAAVAEDATGGRELVVRDRVQKSTEFAHEKFDISDRKESKMKHGVGSYEALIGGESAGFNANIETNAVDA